MTEYRGRFAPSPTGQLHIGSLIGALASYLDAKSNQGLWLVRMEDLDPPREVPGAAQAILQSLRDHGLLWDEEVLWQSRRRPTYQQVIDQLLDCGQAFYCGCSRTDLEAKGGIYPGTCRGRRHPSQPQSAIRLQVENRWIHFDDGIQGCCAQSLATEVGDFVLKRKDGLFAYQLAVVVDDAYQQISHIVRGSDLLGSTGRQIFLQQVLGLTTPQYRHFPVITNQFGQKLSKQTHAPPLLATEARENLLTALAFLQQPQPPKSSRQQVHSILDWALAHWSRQRISKTLAITQSP
jgi:glutamyl-Q tRNA(Asp) synthetase